MPEPTELRVRMVAMLSGLTRETTLFANEEYALPAATAERYYDHGIADIVDPAWKPRARRGDDEHREPLTPGPSPAAVASEESDTAPEKVEPARPARASRAKKETSP